MGRLVAQEVGNRIINRPKPLSWRQAKGTRGEANVGGEKSIQLGPFEKTWWSEKRRASTRTGEMLEKGHAYIYDSSALTAVHEGMHLLENVRKGKGVPEVEASRYGGSKDHPWIEANELYNARNKAEYDRNLASHEHYLATQDTKKTAADNMAAAEYDLGARLMYDPSRGHNVRQTVQAAFESVGGGKAERDTYIKYRNQQSYVGRGNKEPWEFYRK